MLITGLPDWPSMWPVSLIRNFGYYSERDLALMLFVFSWDVLHCAVLVVISELQFRFGSTLNLAVLADVTDNVT